MVEGARLESVYTETYRGFEPLPLRQLRKRWPAVGHLAPTVNGGLSWSPRDGMPRTPPGPEGSSGNGRSGRRGAAGAGRRQF